MIGLGLGGGEGVEDTHLYHILVIKRNHEIAKIDQTNLID
jgi:hypothetical protein